MAAYYPTLWRTAELHLWLPGGGSVFAPAPWGLAFNSMLQHLLAGRFDIDPAAIGREAFLVDGRTYAYFGIFCAALRLPLLPFIDLAQTDVTRLSCLVAVCLGAWAQLRAVLLVRAAVPPSPRRTLLTVALVLAIVLGGQQVQFLKPSIYQEVIDWSGALAMLFVLFTVRGLLNGWFSARETLPMAICAALALLCRVSTGLGLYLALGGLLLLTLWRTPRALTQRHVLPAGLVLLAGMLVCGAVNYGRWGNPLTFADFARYGLALSDFPDRIARLHAYGEFNVQRLWFGALYYLAPIWALPRGDGRLLFEAWQQRWVDSAEMPPGSVLLNPLLVGLAVAFLLLCGRRAARALDRTSALAMLAALSVPALLMMAAISMTFRYQMEFYPPLVLAALSGFRSLCGDGEAARFTRPGMALICGATALGIAAAHAMLALYVWSPWGPAQMYLSQRSYADIYGPSFREMLRQFGL